MRLFGIGIDRLCLVRKLGIYNRILIYGSWLGIGVGKGGEGGGAVMCRQMGLSSEWIERDSVAEVIRATEGARSDG